MQESPVRVFFEPRIAPHAPELYAFETVAEGVDAAAAASPEALARYCEDGFLMVRGLLPAGELGEARAELEAMTLADRPACEMIWYEGALRDHLEMDPSRDRPVDGTSARTGFVLGQEGAGLPHLDAAFRARFVRKLMSFVGRAPMLTRLARHPSILSLVERLIAGVPELFQDMALVKPAFGREKPWHQDHAYFNLAVGTPIVGVWIPMGRVRPENGCMHMLRGGHKAGPRPHFQRRDWQLCDTDVEATDRVAVPMRAGDVLFFDGKIPHGTPTNRTHEFRWAVQFHYRLVAATPVDDEVRLGHFGSEGREVTC
jgi:phytanoyl-CoA hydroxylase